MSFTPAGGGGWTKFVGDALDAAETVSELIEAAKSALRLANGSGDLEDLVTLGITGAGLGAGGLPPGKGKGVDVNNRPILRGGSKGEIEKFRAEEFTADYLRSQGRIVEQNPLESSGRGNLGGDRIVDGVRTEFKRFKTSDPKKLLRKIEKSLSGGGQARNMILDLRGQGITRESAQQVLRDLPKKQRASRLDSIEIIGDSFSIRSRIKVGK